MEIKLRLPLRDIDVTQYFGQEFWFNDPKSGKTYQFYRAYGLDGHPGIDFRTNVGCPVYASHDGVCMHAGFDEVNGNLVQIWDEANGFKTMYGHNSEIKVKQGDQVAAGQLIALAGATGNVTGPHLHWGMKMTGQGGNGLANGNGYNGAIDPSKFIVAAYDGTPIGQKDWDKSRAYHRYYRGRPAGGLEIEKYRVVPALIKFLKRLPTNEEINACTYGGWDRESIANPAMRPVWSQLKKYGEFDKGMRQFS